MTIRIDELDPTVIPARDHEFPSMRDGITVRLTAAQILGLIQRGDLPADVLASLDLADSALQEAGADARYVLQLQPRVDVASATTTDIGAAASQYVRITGTTGPITSLGTAAEGVVRDVLFGGALTLTHNATSLILPRGSNFTTSAGDTALFRSEGSGNWRCMRYQFETGRPLNTSAFYESAQTAYANGAFYTFNHGLGRIPSNVEIRAVCVTAQTGVATAGEWIRVNDPGISSDSTLYGVFWRENSSQIVLHVAPGGIVAVRGDTFASAPVVPANFRLVVRAW